MDYKRYFKAELPELTDEQLDKVVNVIERLIKERLDVDYPYTKQQAALVEGLDEQASKIKSGDPETLKSIQDLFDKISKS
jgi:hypothetical protein